MANRSGNIDWTWVDFSLGEDVRSERRWAQDEQWKDAIADGRKHLSHREANQFLADEFRQSIMQFEVVNLLVSVMNSSTPRRNRRNFAKLNSEVLSSIVEFAYQDHSRLVSNSILLMNRFLSVKASSNFRICVRKRPLSEHEFASNAYDCIHTDLTMPSLTMHDGKLARNGRRLSMNHRGYIFDRVWNENSSNSEVCRDEIDKLVDWARDGHNATLLCFGQTGTGKTYTLNATLDHIGKTLAGCLIEITFLEIYGKKCHDLLRDRQVVHLRADENDHLRVRGARSIRLGEDTPTSKLVELLHDAMRLRSCEVTERNPISSRSHAICIIKLLAPSAASACATTDAVEAPAAAAAAAGGAGATIAADPRSRSTYADATPVGQSKAAGTVEAGARQDSFSVSFSPLKLKVDIPDGADGADGANGADGADDSPVSSVSSVDAIRVMGTITLVDLAGSERNYETVSMTAAQHRESADINSALMALKDCFRAFHAQTQGKKTMQRTKSRCLTREHDLTIARPPYRASLLTRVLKECFTIEHDEAREHRTLIIATVSPSPTDLQHSINSIEHVLLMAPYLHALSSNAQVELPVRGTALSHVPVDQWTPEELCSWLAYAEGGRFAQLVMPVGMDGAALMQMNMGGLSALCEADSQLLREARQGGEGQAWVEQGAEASRGHSALARALWAALRREQQSAQARAAARAGDA